MAVKGEKRRLGFFGERKAVRYLKKRGYRIVARNFKCPFGEVDIIAEDGEAVAFIEVKTRRSLAYGAPNEAVDARRRQRYIRSAKYFYAGRQMQKVVRFDVIEVFNGEINHIVSAFGA